MSIAVYTIDEIRGFVLPLLEKYGFEGASLFGSYARGDADEESDIDILLKGREGFRPLDVFGVAESLHRVSGKQVDVFEVSELDNGPFRDRVLGELVAL